MLYMYAVCMDKSVNLFYSAQDSDSGLLYSSHFSQYFGIMMF